MKINHLIMTLPVAFLLNACSDSTDYNFETSIANQQQIAAAINTASAEVARTFPNNLLYGTDGTLNLPLDEGVAATDVSDPRVALNTLDGFSTIEPITATFGAEVDPTTIVLGETVRVFEVEANIANKVATAVRRELTGTDILAILINNQRTLAMLPLAPLSESTQYMFIVTNGVKNSSGENIEEPSVFLQVASGSEVLTGDASLLENARRLTSPLISLAQGEGIERDSIVLAWSMQTQSITPVLQAVKDGTVAGAMTLADSMFTTQQANPALPGVADIFVGTLDLPYYLTAPSSPDDATGITSFWRGENNSNLTIFNPTPVSTSTQTVPVIMTVPNAASGQTVPAEGWPVAIYVHGVTRNRLDMLAVADAMAVAGIAVIAIDQALHGLTDPANPFSATSSPFPGDVERTFDIDLVDNATMAPGPDGNIDSTGTHFIALRFPLTTRDNLRQSVADLMVLSASVDNITAVPVNAARKTVIGQSLGATTATPFLAFDDSIMAATLAMPAAGLARMLIASPSFGPVLTAGLAAAGLNADTPEFESFLTATQTAVDSGDAINFGAAAAANTPIHIIEVVGDGAGSLPDQTVPNNVATAPLAGTDPLARTMGFDPAMPTSTSSSGPGLVQFIAGEHGSLINPAPNLAVTTEMQTQTANFAASLGTMLVITNTDLVR